MHPPRGSAPRGHKAPCCTLKILNPPPPAPKALQSRGQPLTEQPNAALAPRREPLRDTAGWGGGGGGGGTEGLPPIWEQKGPSGSPQAESHSPHRSCF